MTFTKRLIAEIETDLRNLPIGAACVKHSAQTKEELIRRLNALRKAA